MSTGTKKVAVSPATLPAGIISRNTYDVCVVGGGVVGLWVARYLGAAGLSVVLVEAGRVGSGASGGILGALMAHAPDNWNAKKQFQFDALAELPALAAALEAETGLTTGYAQCGRLMPIRRASFLEQARRRAAQSEENWCTAEARFAFDVISDPPEGDWLSPDLAKLGFVRDTLAARLSPQHYLAALRAGLPACVDVREGTAFTGFERSTGKVKLADDSDRITVGHVVVAAGYRSFDLLEQLIGRAIGGGVKGDAALLECGGVASMPLIYDNGTYIVPHENGTCAVGSTSQKDWSDPDTPDEARTDFIDHARVLCPRLKEAPVIKRWAGVRPRCRLTDPIIGPLASDGKVLVATGGYKITFGIAHRMGRCIMEDIVGAKDPMDMPATYRPEHHLSGRS